jgi:hypothetical protein
MLLACIKSVGDWVLGFARILHFRISGNGVMPGLGQLLHVEMCVYICICTYEAVLKIITLSINLTDSKRDWWPSERCLRAKKSPSRVDFPRKKDRLTTLWFFLLVCSEQKKRFCNFFLSFSHRFPTYNFVRERKERFVNHIGTDNQMPNMSFFLWHKPAPQCRQTRRSLPTRVTRSDEFSTIVLLFILLGSI